MSSKSRPHVTMKDIAQATGYSINTVSHALKDREDISEETRKIIKKKAKELGYLTNQLAVSMRSGKTKTIALIIPDIANPFFSIKIKKIDMLLRKYGYHSIIINTDENSDIEYDAVCSVISRKVDGIIICPTQKRDDIFTLMSRYNMPFVLLGRHYPGRNFYTVTWDDVNGSFLATEYLIKMGSSRILFINGPSCISSSKDRLTGYKLALEQYRISFDKCLVTEIGISDLHVFEQLKLLKDSGLAFDAIFAFSDFVACSCINAALTLDLEVPIVGFDDILSGLNLPISLTSIGADKNKEAELLIDMIFEQIRKTPGSEPRVEILETYLVNRNDT